MSKILQEKISQIKEFNANTVGTRLRDTRVNVIKEINELFYISTDDWDIEQLETRLHRLLSAIEEFKLADAKSSLTENIIKFMEE